MIQIQTFQIKVKYNKDNYQRVIKKAIGKNIKNKI